nr:unnamed protein product [Amyelois transitella]
MTMAARNFFAWKLLMAAETQDSRNQLRQKRRACRSSFNPLWDISEVEFRNRYRLSKEAFLFLCEELKHLTTLKKTLQISLQEKVLVALFFYATGSYQRPVGVAKSLCQKMCSVYIQEVTQALNHPAMLEKYISFPKTLADRQAVSHKFFTKYGLPGVIGCIDGSHFKIFGPPSAEEHLYYCRKHYHSINVQMVCDSDCRIINVNAKFGGQNHDAFIWENSNVNTYMQHLHNRGEIFWLLGDSGYPQRPWLMIPFLEVHPGSPEANYNQKHMRARVLIENTFGRLKNRWRCLCKDRVLHYKPEKCAQIIQACCVLHNIALDYRVAEPHNYDFNVPPQPIEHLRETRISNELIRGRAYRDQLVRKLQNSQ